MTERRVSVRLGIVGGKEVEATFEQLGTRGSAAMKRLGDSSEQAFDKVRTASAGGAGGLQNVGYQIQDFAVQVGAGTSATQALSQQLPQLLSGFGLVGALAGTAAAILIPLAKVMFDLGAGAVDAGEQIDSLVAKIGELKTANQVYSTDGIQGLIDKYGEANAAVLLLVERQQALKEQQAYDAAKAAVASLGQELDDVNGLLEVYDNLTRLAAQDAQWGPDAQSWKEAIENLGLTVDEARALMVALEAVRNAQTIPEMADATATLTGLLEGTTFAGGELEQTLVDTEDALRQLNAQGTGVNSWLDAAIGGAYDLATQFWDAARAAAAVRAAEPKAPSDEALQRRAYGEAQAGLRDRMIADRSLYGGDGNGLTPGEQNAINPPDRPGPRRTRSDRPGPGRTRSGGGSATNELEREAQRIFESTRTEAEQYATELARLEEIKAAGLITGDTYNRQLDALAVKYNQQGDALAGLQEKLADFAAGTKNIAVGIGDAIVDAFESGSDAVADFVKTGKLDFSSLITSFLADMAKLAAQKYIFGPLAGMLSGALGGAGGLLANVLHEGGNVGGSGTRRSVPVAAFAGAPRFHNGVNLGLASDELPAILQRGERVLSRAENKAYGRQQGPMVVNFNVKDAASMRQSRAQMAADAQRIVGAGARNR